jgi:hypothetical protein
MAKIKRPTRPQGPRIGLTVTPELLAVLQRISDATGTGKASFITQWLLESLPALTQLATALELAKNKNADSFLIIEKVLRENSEDSAQLALQIQATRRRVPRSKKPATKKKRVKHAAV